MMTHNETLFFTCAFHEPFNSFKCSLIETELKHLPAQLRWLIEACLKSVGEHAQVDMALRLPASPLEQLLQIPRRSCLEKYDLSELLVICDVLRPCLHATRLQIIHPCMKLPDHVIGELVFCGVKLVTVITTARPQPVHAIPTVSEPGSMPVATHVFKKLTHHTDWIFSDSNYFTAASFAALLPAEWLQDLVEFSSCALQRWRPPTLLARAQLANLQ